MKRLIFILLSLLSISSIAQTTRPRYENRVVAGTNTYTLLVTPTPDIHDGLTYSVTFTNQNSGASTFNVSSTGALPLVNSDGTALSSATIKAGQTIDVRYDAGLNKWKLVGGAGGSSFSLTGGSGTTANGTAVDIVGTLNSTANIELTNSYIFRVRNGGSSTGQLIVSGDPTSGYTELTSNVSGTVSAYMGTSFANQWAAMTYTNTTNVKRIQVGSASGIPITEDIDAIGLRYASDYGTNGKALGARWIPDWGNVLGAKTFTGAQTFISSGIKLQNPAATFSYTFVGAAIVASRNITLPLLTGNDVMVTEAFIQTLTNKTISGASNTITNVSLTTGVTGVLPAANGGAGTINGILKANGSGTVSAASAGTDYLAPSGSGAALSGVYLLASGGTASGANTFTLTATNTMTFSASALGTTPTEIFLLHNPTAGAAGAQQTSPMEVFSLFAWKTNATAASQSVKFGVYGLGVQGAANPTGNLIWASNVNAAGYTPLMQLDSRGYLGLNAAPSLGTFHLVGISGVTTMYVKSGSGTDGYLLDAAAQSLEPLNDGNTALGSSSKRWAGMTSFRARIIGGDLGVNQSNTVVGHLQLGASTTSKAHITLEVGVAPTSPTDGQIWWESNTNTGLKMRVNGVTKTVSLL